MTDEQRAEFKKELVSLVTKYGLTDAAFCATEETSDASVLFYGTFVGAERLSVAELAEVTVNVGRLWQHAREQMRTALNYYDVWEGRRK